MTELSAEVEWVTKTLVRVDIDKLCRHYADDRANFEGSDVEFAKDLLKDDLKSLLEPQTGDFDGIEIEGEWDDGEIHFYGVSE